MDVPTAITSIVFAARLMLVPVTVQVQPTPPWNVLQEDLWTVGLDGDDGADGR